MLKFSLRDRKVKKTSQVVLAKYFDTVLLFTIASFIYKWNGSKLLNYYHQDLKIFGHVRRILKIDTDIPSAHSPLQKSGNSPKKQKQASYWAFYRKCYFTGFCRYISKFLWRITLENAIFFLSQSRVFVVLLSLRF